MQAERVRDEGKLRDKSRERDTDRRGHPRSVMAAPHASREGQRGIITRGRETRLIIGGEGNGGRRGGSKQAQCPEPIADAAPRSRSPAGPMHEPCCCIIKGLQHTEH